MLAVMHQEFNLDTILEKLVYQIKKNCSLILSNKSEQLWNDFHDHLFKINVPMPFEDIHKNRFMGIIKGVSTDGKLQVILEDETIENYGIKEIQMLF